MRHRTSRSVLSYSILPTQSAHLPHQPAAGLPLGAWLSRQQLACTMHTHVVAGLEPVAECRRLCGTICIQAVAGAEAVAGGQGCSSLPVFSARYSRMAPDSNRASGLPPAEGSTHSAAQCRRCSKMHCEQRGTACIQATARQHAALLRP